MKHVYLIILSLIIALSLAENNKTSTATLEERNLDIEDLAIYSDKNNHNNLKKRNSAYIYPKPNRIKLRSRFTSNLSPKNRGKFSRLNTPVRPFDTYGPPKQNSLQFPINNHPSRRPSLQQNKNTPIHSRPVEGIRFPPSSNSNHASENFQLGVPSPIREVDFTEPNSIASQNDEPFKLNSANYLPPKNQRLPVHQTSSIFMPNSPPLYLNSQINNINNNNHHNIGHNQNLINHQPNSQISDAAQFLVQNSAAISQLYDTPAPNIDYAPIDNSELVDQVNNLNNFQKLQSTELSNVDTIRQSFPSYSSGILEQIQSLEKDRLIAQLQQELVQRQVQDPSRYVQQSPDDNSKLLSIQSPQLHNSASIFGLQGVSSQQLGLKSENLLSSSLNNNVVVGRSLTYGVPPPPSSVTSTSSTQLQTTSPTAISNASVDRPQNNVEGSSHGVTLVPTTSSKPPTVFPFPQYGGFIPTLIAGTNFASPPSYGTTFVSSNSFHTTPGGQVIESTPTHFDIPIPTVTGSSNSGSSKPSIAGDASLHPTASKPLDLSAGSPSSLHPSIPVRPIQPIFPIVPTVTQVQTSVNSVLHPQYNPQPTLVNSVLLKPVKPVYPVYYYPNLPYQLQKHQYIFPWNYAPTYSQSKSDKW